MYAGRKGENSREGREGIVVAEEALWEVPGHFLPKAESGFSERFRGEYLVWILQGRGI